MKEDISERDNKYKQQLDDIHKHFRDASEKLKFQSLLEKHKQELGENIQKQHEEQNRKRKMLDEKMFALVENNKMDKLSAQIEVKLANLGNNISNLNRIQYQQPHVMQPAQHNINPHHDEPVHTQPYKKLYRKHQQINMQSPPYQQPQQCQQPYQQPQQNMQPPPYQQP